MKVDCLVAEIGSTTTIVNAFNIHQGPVEFLGRGIHRTTIEDSVNNGLTKAIYDLKENLNVKELEYKELFASSSAAGGLKITVHGLVYEMTAKAAKEAALGAGANIHLITAFDIDQDTVLKVKEINPNMIIIAGGTDFGEKEVSFNNLLKLIDLNIPIIYTGNIVNHDRIRKLNKSHIEIIDNVYPKVDDFNILPLREKIYETFEKNIIYAKGMKEIFEMVNDHIIPTPGAVMESTIMLNEIFDGVLTIDVGGATTDIHSIAEPKLEYIKYILEPKFKRTVEGDLGVYINRLEVLKTFKKGEIEKITGKTHDHILEILKNEPYIPTSEEGILVIEALTRQSVYQALDRHIGEIGRVYTTSGFKVVPKGRDLSLVKAIFLTGGALIHHSNPKSIIKDYLAKSFNKLIPNQDVEIYIDKDYIFASLGILSRIYPMKAKELLLKSIQYEGEINVS